MWKAEGLRSARIFSEILAEAQAWSFPLSGKTNGHKKKPAYGIWKRGLTPRPKYRNISQVCSDVVMKAKVQLKVQECGKSLRKGFHRYVVRKWKYMEDLGLLLNEMVS